MRCQGFSGAINFAVTVKGHDLSDVEFEEHIWREEISYRKVLHRGSEAVG